VTEENVIGNFYDKYETRNPVAGKLMSDFIGSVKSLFLEARPDTFLEVGCGEGLLTQQLLDISVGPLNRVEACDLSLGRIAEGLDSSIVFKEASIFELPYEQNEFDLVVCCEVLEHIEDPASGLAELCRVARRAVLISTPWEPVWCILNLLRGKYISRLSNTPGHIQHFGRRDLINLAKTHLDDLRVKTPLP